LQGVAARLQAENVVVSVDDREEGMNENEMGRSTPWQSTTRTRRNKRRERGGRERRDGVGGSIKATEGRRGHYINVSVNLSRLGNVNMSKGKSREKGKEA